MYPTSDPFGGALDVLSGIQIEHYVLAPSGKFSSKFRDVPMPTETDLQKCGLEATTSEATTIGLSAERRHGLEKAKASLSAKAKAFLSELGPNLQEAIADGRMEIHEGGSTIRLCLAGHCDCGPSLKLGKVDGFGDPLKSVPFAESWYSSSAAPTQSASDVPLSDSVGF